MKLLEIRNLSIAFRVDRHTTVEAVKGISFSVPHNATVALVGESGSGKSVSAMAIMGLLDPAAAIIDPDSRIIFDGSAMRGKDIAMIFQEPMSSLNPVFSIGAQIAEVLKLHMGMRTAQARRRTLELLEEVGIPDPAQRIDAYPSQLSGGQQQRVMIAMAIACEPRLLIADEPTTALDVTIQKQILQLIAELQQRRGMSVLFITHDLDLAAEIADHVVVMCKGEVREAGPAKQVLTTPTDDYTRALLDCRAALATRRRAPLPASASEAPPLLEVRQLRKTFLLRDGWLRRRTFHALENVSFTLARGQTLGVVGESGSGKTTLGLTLLRLHQASGGSVLFEGRDLLAMPVREFQAYKRRMQIIFQNPYASLNPRFTVGDILLEPLRIHRIGADDRVRMAIVHELLEKVGLPAAATARYPHEFSGGQRQRIAIARCLTLRPEILVCDESVSALDVSVQAQVLNLLQDLQDELGLSYIFISHDLSVVRHMADQVMVMRHGAVVELAGTEALYGDPQHPYTRALLAAMPHHG
ncbi:MULTISPECIES: ABC transporter ATP-binding protein [unclassified Duganella]|uniref:ABC transporter ATP-binding protein n=1 Tax=unclassified Duganella TaxID=2636909 RepID=UPI0008878E1E|nr:MULTISPECIES: dipeptide ABC transporter ATP-binding protein [unclassified Duganella]SDH04473.1 peptide/nickel transport system ATP-binding protein [Duganella sp. OV458]SDK21627.1 peptide/nickel transport system ATP-binding protein [Duganella sp. OV510]